MNRPLPKLAVLFALPFFVAFALPMFVGCADPEPAQATPEELEQHRQEMIDASARERGG